MSLYEALNKQVKTHGVAAATEAFTEALNEKKINPRNFSFRGLGETLMGPQWQNKVRRHLVGDRLLESIDAIDASAFTAISGQLLVDRVKEKYKLATFVTDSLVPTEAITNGNLGPHIEPYHSNVINEPTIVQQLEPIPFTRFAGQYITHPAPQKAGQICAISWEMLFADLTGQAIQSAESVGERLGLWVEKQRLRVILGITNPHVFNGNSLNTYQTTTTTNGNYINALDNFVLTDFDSINTLEQLAYQIVDPVTSQNIQIDMKHMLVLPKLKYTAKRILNATEVRSGDITTGAGIQQISTNPLDSQYQLYTTAHGRNLLVNEGTNVSSTEADTYVILGDFGKAFVWREAMPITVSQLPPGNSFEFTQDVAIAVKAETYGSCSVRDPRYVFRGRNGSF